MPIPQWSFSKIQIFSQCKFRAYLQYDQKIPEPERPLPPGKTEHANDRGSRIHEAAEAYVRGNGPLIPELMKFQPEFESLRQLFVEGKVCLEDEWAMDRDWAPVPWNGQWEPVEKDRLTATQIGDSRKVAKLPARGKDGEAVQVGKQLYLWVDSWLRLKLDALIFLSPFEAVAVDYKTGKRFGNEIKHAEQTQLYQLVSFLRYPKLEIIHTELWYLDVDERAHSVFTRQQGMRFLPSMTKKGRAITECLDFPPSPSIFGCQKAYCPYGTWEGGTGHCAVGVPRN
jgi:hypothetical protein